MGNTEVQEQGVGVMAENPDTVDRAVLQVLNNAEMRERIEACQHRGIFDAVDIIRDLIDGDDEECSGEKTSSEIDRFIGQPSDVV